MHRKKIISFLVLTMCFQLTISAQNDTIWYDQEWNETSKFYAEYFRPKPEEKKGKYIIKDYYINGQLQMEGTSARQDTTIFDGVVIRFYKSGTKQSQVNYKNGILNGRATQFFENGKISYTAPFIDGIQNGTYKAYYNNGNLRGSIELKNNIRDGIYEEFYENGNKKAYIIYKDGNQNGDLIEYYENGNIRYTSYLVNGILQGKVKAYDSDGQLKTSGKFIDNKKDGLWKSIGFNQEIITRHYKNDKLNGEITYEAEIDEDMFTYYYKGYGSYKDNKLISWRLEKTLNEAYKPYRTMSIENNQEIWKNYDDDDGILKSETSYGKDGIENGNWKFYYPNHNIQHDINFIADDCQDIASNYISVDVEEIEETVIESTESYDIDTKNHNPKVPRLHLPGLLLKQENFRLEYKCKASANGEYTHYYENGNPKLKAVFKHGKPIGDIHLFDTSNKQLTFKYEKDSEAINKSIKITPIETESYVNIDYSDIEPEPFEMIIYYNNDYGESSIKRVVVHPILRQYILNLSLDSNLFLIINNKLNAIEHVNFFIEDLSKEIYYNTHNYNDSSFDN